MCKKKLLRAFLKVCKEKKKAANITDKGLISLIYKEQPKVNKEKDLQTNRKVGNGSR